MSAFKKEMAPAPGFDEEAECKKHDADEEPCGTSRRRSGARHKALKSAEVERGGAARQPTKENPLPEMDKRKSFFQREA